MTITIHLNRYFVIRLIQALECLFIFLFQEIGNTRCQYQRNYNTYRFKENCPLSPMPFVLIDGNTHRQHKCSDQDLEEGVSKTTKEANNED